MTILFFSATGNCLSAAKHIGGDLKSIPQLERAGEYEISDDVIGIVSPVYYLTLPLLVKRYLSKARLEADYVFGILTYGFASGNAAYKLAKALEANGNEIHYAADLLMADNYLPNFNMEKQIAKLPNKNIDGRIAKIIRDIESRRYKAPHNSLLWRMVAGILGYSKVESDKGISAVNHTDEKFIVTEKCSGCGTCARVCPVSNITIEDKPAFHHNCESCFACIHNCPEGAIQLERQKSEARFRNNNVTLKELIKANGS
jgi:ferredoxin